MAGHPLNIPLKGWGQILYRVFVRVTQDRINVIAGGVAYFLLLSLFPALGSLIAVFGLFSDPLIITEHINSLDGIIPPEVTTTLHEQALTIAEKSSKTLGVSAILGLIFSLYTALLGMKALMRGTNIAYDERENRKLIYFNLTAFFLTIVFFSFFFVAISTMIILPPIFSYLQIDIENYLPVLKWPFIMIYLMLTLSAIYFFGPNRKTPKWIWISPGSILATLIWLGGTWAFSEYVESFDAYNKTYGTLGAGVIMLVWLWLTGFIILLGAVLNAEIERQIGTMQSHSPNHSSDQ